MCWVFADVCVMFWFWCRLPVSDLCLDAFTRRFFRGAGLLCFCRLSFRAGMGCESLVTVLWHFCDSLRFWISLDFSYFGILSRLWQLWQLWHFFELQFCSGDLALGVMCAGWFGQWVLTNSPRGLGHRLHTDFPQIRRRYPAGLAAEIRRPS